MFRCCKASKQRREYEDVRSTSQAGPLGRVITKSKSREEDAKAIQAWRNKRNSSPSAAVSRSSSSSNSVTRNSLSKRTSKKNNRIIADHRLISPQPSLQEVEQHQEQVGLSASASSEGVEVKRIELSNEALMAWKDRGRQQHARQKEGDDMVEEHDESQNNFSFDEDDEKFFNKHEIPQQYRQRVVEQAREQSLVYDSSESDAPNEPTRIHTSNDYNYKYEVKIADRIMKYQQRIPIPENKAMPSSSVVYSSGDDEQQHQQSLNNPIRNEEFYTTEEESLMDSVLSRPGTDEGDLKPEKLRKTELKELDAIVASIGMSLSQSPPPVSPLSPHYNYNPSSDQKTSGSLQSGNSRSTPSPVDFTSSSRQEQQRTRPENRSIDSPSYSSLMNTSNFTLPKRQGPQQTSSRSSPDVSINISMSDELSTPYAIDGVTRYDIYHKHHMGGKMSERSRSPHGEELHKHRPKEEDDPEPPPKSNNNTVKKPSSSTPQSSMLTQETEALSDVPSDVESDVRERYLAACRILKATLIEKKGDASALDPTDIEFLANLVSQTRKMLSNDEITSAYSLFDFSNRGAIPTEEQLTAIESAAETLLSKSEFSVGSLGSSAFHEHVPFNPNNPAEADLIRTATRAAQNSLLGKTPPAAQSRTSPINVRAPSPASSRLSERTVRVQNGIGKNRNVLSSEELITMHRIQTLREHGEFITNSNAPDFHHPKAQSNVSSLFSEEDEIIQPFHILGAKDKFHPTVLTPSVMEALRGFFPYAVTEENFWLKYALGRDGNALSALLANVQGCKHTIIAVKTKDDYVFGAFCSSPWRVKPDWYGSGESFLWRLKGPTSADNSRNKNRSPRVYNEDESSVDDMSDETKHEMEVYPYTGHDDMVQYCTRRTLAVGGGSEWSDGNGGSPYSEPTGIGLMIDGDLMGGETNACATFANPRLGDRSSNKNEFDISALEVWTVTPCSTEEDARKMEESLTFLEKNSTLAKK